MEMPSATELESDPAGSFRRLRCLRADIDEAESIALAAWLRRGGNLSTFASRVGISKQALTQRMQRRLQTRRPAAVLRGVARAERAAVAQRRYEADRALLAKLDRLRAEAAADRPAYLPEPIERFPKIDENGLGPCDDLGDPYAAEPNAAGPYELGGG